MIIIAYVDLERSELGDHRPTIVHVDARNRIVDEEESALAAASANDA